MKIFRTMLCLIIAILMTVRSSFLCSNLGGRDRTLFNDRCC